MIVKIIIAGSRDFIGYNILCDEVDLFIEQLRERKAIIEGEAITVVSGGARGADKLGERYASEHGYFCEVYEADWKRYGNRAGILRNMEMAELSDACVVFNVNNSKGSTHMASHARKIMLPTKEIKISQ